MQRILKGLILMAATLPTAVYAQNNCANRDLVITKLTDNYGEALRGGGLQNASRVFEVWFSEEKGTWTILMTRADGTTCIMASGTNWREVEPTLKQPAGIKG